MLIDVGSEAALRLREKVEPRVIAGPRAVLYRVLLLSKRVN